MTLNRFYVHVVKVYIQVQPFHPGTPGRCECNMNLPVGVSTAMAWEKDTPCLAACFWFSWSISIHSNHFSITCPGTPGWCEWNVELPVCTSTTREKTHLVGSLLLVLMQYFNTFQSRCPGTPGRCEWNVNLPVCSVTAREKDTPCWQPASGSHAVF